MGCSLRAVVTGKEIMKETPPNADKSTTPLHTALSLSLSFLLSFSFLSFPGRWAGESFERTSEEIAAMNEASHLTRDASMYSLLLPLLFPSCFSQWLLLYICLRLYCLHIYVHTDINVCSFLNQLHPTYISTIIQVLESIEQWLLLQLWGCVYVADCFMQVYVDRSGSVWSCVEIPCFLMSLSSAITHIQIQFLSFTCMVVLPARSIIKNICS